MGGQLDPNGSTGGSMRDSLSYRLEKIYCALGLRVFLLLKAEAGYCFFFILKLEARRKNSSKLKGEGNKSSTT